MLNKLINSKLTLDLIKKSISSSEQFKFYSSEANKKRPQQNQFYFEKSILLDEKSEDYAKRYAEIPVVVLLGWSGAFDSHLRKYSQIYNSLGYHTIRLAPSNQLVFFNPKAHKSYAMQFLNLMKNEHKLNRNPILIHNFSNAGFFVVYVNSIRILNDKSELSKEFEFFEHNRKGMIFDSSSAVMNSFSSVFEAANVIFESQIKIKILRYLFSFFFASLSEILRLVTKENDYFSQAIKYYLSKDARLMPTMFMYSKTDKVVPCELIERNIETRKTNFPRQDISQVVFESAEHVKLYLKDPQKYLEAIKTHIKKCGLEINLEKFKESNKSKI